MLTHSLNFVCGVPGWLGWPAQNTLTEPGTARAASVRRSGDRDSITVSCALTKCSSVPSVKVRCVLGAKASTWWR